jgi:hypothetical protein
MRHVWRLTLNYSGPRVHRLPQRLDFVLMPAPLGKCSSTDHALLHLIRLHRHASALFGEVTIAFHHRYTSPQRRGLSSQRLSFLYRLFGTTNQTAALGTHCTVSLPVPIQTSHHHLPSRPHVHNGQSCHRLSVCGGLPSSRFIREWFCFWRCPGGAVWAPAVKLLQMTNANLSPRRGPMTDC